MRNLSTGSGLALLGGAIIAYPWISRIAAIETTAHASLPSNAARAVAAVGTSQVAPTIVWYGVAPSTSDSSYTRIFRAWSNGRLEATEGFLYCGQSSAGQGVSAWYGRSEYCTSRWTVVSDSNQGLSAASDINFDGKVDGNDLGQLLAGWGDAPRHDVPPSDCPLTLINP